MPRKPEATKHPALVSKNRLEEKRQALGEAESRMIWESLTPEQKDFLAQLPRNASHADTARVIGKDKVWIDHQKVNHPLFARAISEMLFTGNRLAYAMVHDSIGPSMQKLWEMIESPKTSERVRLDAIKHWQKIQGIGVDTAPMSFSQTNYIDTTTIGSIAKNRKRPRFRTVEGELADS